MSDGPFEVSLDDLGLTHEKCLELVNRMNAKWPGKFVLITRCGAYLNAMANPNMFNQYQAQANPHLFQ